MRRYPISLNIKTTILLFLSIIAHSILNVKINGYQYSIIFDSSRLEIQYFHQDILKY